METQERTCKTWEENSDFPKRSKRMIFVLLKFYAVLALLCACFLVLQSELSKPLFMAVIIYPYFLLVAVLVWLFGVFFWKWHYKKFNCWPKLNTHVTYRAGWWGLYIGLYIVIFYSLIAIFLHYI